jgi:hypothetical protein
MNGYTWMCKDDGPVTFQNQNTSQLQLVINLLVGIHDRISANKTTNKRRLSFVASKCAAKYLKLKMRK